MTNKEYNKGIGTSFDSFLEEEKILADVEATALKRVLTWQLSQEMEKLKINKTEMARRMNTSRASVERLLDPNNPSLTLKSLERAAHVLHKTIKIELCDSL
ncbi:Uncharacterized protein NF27_AD00040 [Candidatus Jidaibacter acanthamoeba]|uniref:Uncharacterized protein n=1 Tax=Candidatus Jidaibacter acanthamoebae TaxID=86105 RepID=A0A0C1MVL2_9RICK|nr:XRE family transcriptional regulator [Candidatus Jidaibacter acanthamoeba]KIE06292.1 Uncharacterized protein NF27_AD00040 [Candidatus Jidaibacter acanthamoeba]